jgi:hypothetical protein
MKTFKIFLNPDHGIQVYGITVKCNEIKQDENNSTACFIDNVWIDFDMTIKRIEVITE